MTCSYKYSYSYKYSINVVINEFIPLCQTGVMEGGALDHPYVGFGGRGRNRHQAPSIILHTIILSYILSYLTSTRYILNMYYFLSKFSSISFSVLIHIKESNNMYSILAENHVGNPEG